MADENDFTDYLPPAMAERTPAEEEEHAELDKLEEEQRKSILEQIGRDSDLLFKDPRWNTLHVLSLIAFKDQRRIVDNSWHWLRPRMPAPVETNPCKVLHNWLLEERITASIEGEEKSPSFWDDKEYYNLRRKFPNACFRRDDLLKLVFGDRETLEMQKETVQKKEAATHLRNRGGRPPVINWEFVEGEVFRLMDENGGFLAGDKEWNAQARLEEKIKDFCSTKFDYEPASSTIQERIKPMLIEWSEKKAQR